MVDMFQRKSVRVAARQARLVIAPLLLGATALGALGFAPAALAQAAGSTQPAPAASTQPAVQVGTGAASSSAAGEQASGAEQSSAAEAAGEKPKGFGSDWESWKAGNSVADLASLQRGARDFLNYCNGCHSLKYMRYSRIGRDLQIPPELLQKYLVPADRNANDYISSPMPAKDAEAWFGKQPPDLSLMARERGTAYLYQFLSTFYVDPSRPTGANNLALPTTAMPDILSELEGLKRAVFKDAEVNGTRQKVFDHFETVAPGSLSREQYESFVRDIVNFLSYVGEPAQVHRRALGVWVVLFLLVFTWLAWLLKKEYWKDVK